MAVIGLKHFVYATGSYTDNTAPTYTNGAVLGKAMKADLTWNRGSAKLYADDRLVEQDNSITGGELTIGVSYLALTARAKLLSDATFGSSTDPQVYATQDTPSPYVGIGFVTKESADGGSAKYYGWWYYKVQFAMDESAATKGESVEYTTPELKGTITGITPASADYIVRFREFAEFSTEAAAITWVNGKAGITA